MRSFLLKIREFGYFVENIKLQVMSLFMSVIPFSVSVMTNPYLFLAFLFIVYVTNIGGRKYEELFQDVRELDTRYAAMDTRSAKRSKELSYESR
jgi:hypothetical protein